MVSPRVTIPLNSRNSNRLRALGYRVPNSFERGATLEVRLEDLSPGSKVKVPRICDACKREDLVAFRDLGSKEFCKKCAQKRQTGAKNPFFGKKHSPATLQKLKSKKVDPKKISEGRIRRFALDHGFDSPRALAQALVDFLEEHQCGIRSAFFQAGFPINPQHALGTLRRIGRLDLASESPSFKKARIEKENQEQRELFAKSRGYENHAALSRAILEFFDQPACSPYSPQTREHFPHISLTTISSILKENGKTDVFFKFNSNGERALGEFIESLGIPFERNNRGVLGGKEIDIWIPSFKLGIEFNGLFWHSSAVKEKTYHYDKRLLAESKGIRLIQVNSDEWIFKSEIVKSMLQNLLGRSEHRIGARKCEVRKLSKTLSAQFLIDNHLMGSCEGTTNWGLFLGTHLVQVMTVRNKSGILDISRFCTLRGWSVQGGFSKLLRALERHYQPQKNRKLCRPKVCYGGQSPSLWVSRRSHPYWVALDGWVKNLQSTEL